MIFSRCRKTQCVLCVSFDVQTPVYSTNTWESSLKLYCQCNTGESSLICTANRLAGLTPDNSTVQYLGKLPNSVLSVQYWRKFSTFVLSINTIRPGGAYCVQTPDRTAVQCVAGKSFLHLYRKSLLCWYYNFCLSQYNSKYNQGVNDAQNVHGWTAPRTRSRDTARPPMMRTLWLMSDDESVPGHNNHLLQNQSCRDLKTINGLFIRLF